MDTPAVEFEGTWEEIQKHGERLRGKRLRLSVLDSASESANVKGLVVDLPAKGPSTAESLLPFVGIWEGDDIQDCLDMVYATRSRARP